MKRSLLSLFLIFVSVAMIAQTGIRGILTNTAGEPVGFAFVSLLKGEEQVYGNYTGMDGSFEILIEPGAYLLVFDSPEFGKEEVEVTVNSGAMTEFSYQYKEEGEQLDVVDIVVEKREVGVAEQVEEVKESVEQKVVLGEKEIAKKGESNVAGATKKMTGISVVGSKFVFVRGMGDRYNNATLNGLPVPSPDPDRKVIPLSIFPSGIVKSLSVSKTYLPWYYGDYAGGMIDIRTKDYPTEHILKLNYSTSFNTISSFQDFLTYEGGAYDYFGFDDGGRKFPSSLRKDDPTLDGFEIGDLYESSRDGTPGETPFEGNWDVKKITAPVNMGYGLTYGNQIKKSTGINKYNTFGYLVNANYSNTYQYQPGKFALINAQDVRRLDYEFDSYNYNTQTSVLTNIHYDMAKKHFFDYTLLYTNISSDQTRQTSGFHFDYPVDGVASTRFTYRQNQLMVNQIRGSHLLLDDNRLKIDWAGSYSTTNNTEPNRRQLVYWYDNTPEGRSYQFNSLDQIENHRFFNELFENEIAGLASAKYKALYGLGKMDTISGLRDTVPILTLDFGVQTKVKNREFKYWMMTYDISDVDETLGTGIDPMNPTQYIPGSDYGITYDVSNAALGDRQHTAEMTVNSTYLNAIYEIIPEKFSVVAGARLEQSSQVIYYKLQTASIFAPKDESRIDTVSLLPSISFRYNLGEKNVFRIAASQTISRPGFREMAPFEYTEFFAGVKNVGNPNLINGTNYNFDVKYEFYPSAAETFNLTGFYKQLIDPIEKTMLATGSGQLQSFQNTEGATVAGFELELNKNLAFLSKKPLPENPMRHFSVSANAAYIYSQVTIDTTGDASVIATNLKRPLQGASPYLANADVSYEKGFGLDSLGNYKYRTTITLSYNVFGRRLYAAGVLGIGDSYEIPVNTMNLVAQLSKGDWDFKLKIANLLNPRFAIVQESPITGEDLVTNEYRIGQTFSFSVGYNIGLGKK